MSKEQQAKRGKQLWLLIRDDDDGQLIVTRAEDGYMFLDCKNLPNGESNPRRKYFGSWVEVKSSFKRIELRRLARLVGEECKFAEGFEYRAPQNDE